MKEYIPQPIDTKNVTIDESLLELTELLAKNVHETWSAGRINEGWKYGPTRNENEKTHPCLVPYEQLPENEKDYDRNTALETLKIIIKMGYKIEKI